MNGDTIWTRSVGRYNYDYAAQGLLVCSDGGFLFSGVVWGELPGNQSGLPYIFKTDSLGHFTCWERHYPIEVTSLFPVDSSFTLDPVGGVTVHPAFVNDTVFDPIIVYDGCTFTTGAPQMVRQNPRVHAHPNPTTGRLTLEFTSPLEADSFYSVFDVMGRLLFQRPLVQGTQSEEIDLSRFGKGTYVVRVTGREGVCYERVVVQ